MAMSAVATGVFFLANRILDSFNTQMDRKFQEMYQQAQLKTQEICSRDVDRELQFQYRLHKEKSLWERHRLALELRHQTIEAEKDRVFTQQENALNRAIQKAALDLQHDEGESNRNLQAYMFYVQQINRRWPLRIDPMEFISQNLHFSQFFERTKEGSQKQLLNEIQPLKVILVNSISGDAAAFQMSEEAAVGTIRKFIANHYGILQNENPVELLDGAWDDTKLSGGAAIHNIFTIMRRTPALIMETRKNGDFLEFNFAYWNGLTQNYNYQHALRIDWELLTAELCRRSVDRLYSAGFFHLQQNETANFETQNMLADFSLPFRKNMELLLLEKNIASEYREMMPWYRNYEVTPDVVRELQVLLGTLQTFLVALYSDLHHLYFNLAAPILPKYYNIFSKKLQIFQDLKFAGFPNREGLVDIYCKAFESVLTTSSSSQVRINYVQTLYDLGEFHEAFEQFERAIDELADMLGIGIPSIGERTELLERKLACLRNELQGEEIVTILDETGDLLLKKAEIMK